MNYKLLLAATLFCSTVNAQETITPEVLKTVASGYQSTPANKALRNAIMTNDLSLLVLDQDQVGEADTHFSHEVKSRGVTDQKSSGRCWLFTGLNVLRARMIADQNLGDFRFSQVYLFFYDQLEKSNLFLQGIIETADRPIDDRQVEWLFKNALSDGGTFTGVADLVAKYGVVPASVMPETFNSNNTRSIDALLQRKLREDGIRLRAMAAKGQKRKALEKEKVEQLKTIYHMLVMAYGQPPTEFQWAPRKADGSLRSALKTYTPQSFYKEFLGQDLQNDFVMLMNDPSRPYYKTYEIDRDRHVQEGHNWLYLNLPNEDIKPMAIRSIKDSTMMYSSCDVGKYLSKATGILSLQNYDYQSLMGTTFGMNKAERIQSFDSGSSHAMTLMAVDLDENDRPRKWKVENSWGPSYGAAGHLIMTDEWFDEYMFRVVVNKRYVDARFLEMLKQKPTLLPAWDPMFRMEE